MINKSKILRVVSLSLVLAGTFFAGYAVNVSAQTRDPFVKPPYLRQQNASRSNGQPAKPGTGAAMTPGAPSIEQRIEYYKRLREQAAANGSQLPKVTSVLTLNEMAVTGIFRTPRGYAAMVEATPIKLSYTIYPGEKFFDGQLVAVEENRLVFRRVTKTGNGKFVASVENKALRQYSTKSQVEGTAPVQGGERPAEPAANVQATADGPEKKAAPVVIISPLDEMNKTPQKTDGEKEKTGKNAKKPAKVAKNK